MDMIYHILFIRSPGGGHLDCFISAIRSNAAEHLYESLCMSTCFYFS